MNEQLIDDLKASRAELVTRGRCKGQYCTGDEKVCSVGALRLVVAAEQYERLYMTIMNCQLGSDRYMEAYSALRSHIDGDLTLWEFNDKSTDQEVLELWDKTLADLGGMG